MGAELPQLPGTGDFEQPDSFDVDAYAEHLLDSGELFDPFDGDNIAAALGEMNEGELVDAGVALRKGTAFHDRKFCHVVRTIVAAYCKRRAYEFACSKTEDES